MTDMTSIRKQLKIRTGVVQRLTKEHGLYHKEVIAQQQKLDKITVEQVGTEDYDWNVKNAKTMLEESKKMIIDVATRLDKASDDLNSYIIIAKKEEQLAGDEDLSKAVEALEACPKSTA